MGTSFIIPMLFLFFPFSDMVVNGMENDREDMRMRLKEEIKLELVEEMRREAQEDVESLLEKRLADLREELEEELLGKLMRNGSLGMIVAASTPQHIVCATQVLTGTCLTPQEVLTAYTCGGNKHFHYKYQWNYIQLNARRT